MEYGFGCLHTQTVTVRNAENEVYLSLKVKHYITNSKAMKSEACTVHYWLVCHYSIFKLNKVT